MAIKYQAHRDGKRKGKTARQGPSGPLLPRRALLGVGPHPCFSTLSVFFPHPLRVAPTASPLPSEFHLVPAGLRTLPQVEGKHVSLMPVLLLAFPEANVNGLWD